MRSGKMKLPEIYMAYEGAQEESCRTHAHTVHTHFKDLCLPL